jgi:hypothetical protein
MQTARHAGRGASTGHGLTYRPLLHDATGGNCPSRSLREMRCDCEATPIVME